MRKTTLPIFWWATSLLLVIVLLTSTIGVQARSDVYERTSAGGGPTIYLPIVITNTTSTSSADWIQQAHDAQHTSASPTQVDGPFCYTWKWYEAPIASRAQPVVANGRLFIGSMTGMIYARNASTGAPLWQYQTGGPIRNTGAIAGNVVVFSSHDGYTYGLASSNGSLLWKSITGPSVTAPLVANNPNIVIVASSNGVLSLLNSLTGAISWQFQSGAPILTSPAMSTDGGKIFIGNEAIQAIAVRSSDGVELWRTQLHGLSLADRFPVVAGDKVIFRSQPNYNFSILLREGDDVMDGTYSAGISQPILDDWSSDWVGVRARILAYLNQEPSKQTFFVLDANTGQSAGTVPVLYTYGNNDTPNTPVVTANGVYVTYRARHGIQNDSGTIHVSSRYDAELGILNLNTLDITGLTSAELVSGVAQFRMTSDEPSMLSMSGNILYVDNWERLGGINTSNGDLIHVSAVSNDWPECGVQCGMGTDLPFFPMNGGAAYPFPQPRVTEGVQMGGMVIANNMLYWKVIEAGLGGLSHRTGSTCAATSVWIGPNPLTDETIPAAPADSVMLRPLADYITLDLTTPDPNPNPVVVQQIQAQVGAITSAGGHLMPMFLHRGYTRSQIWPYNTTNPCSPTPCLPEITHSATGNAYWFDPGELLYTMALAYPYLTSQQQLAARNYMAAEMARYPTLEDLPWGTNEWLKQGVARETFDVDFRSSINNWPPPGRNLSTIYGLWLWSKNTGDWSYAQSHWSDVVALFNLRKGSINYYSDISGLIGYARLAAHFGYTTDYNNGVQAALTAMQAGLNFTTFCTRAESQYPDPPNETTGWYAPVFYGITPEVGLYLREQLGGAAETYLYSKESGNGLRWWYLTRVGVHAEKFESSFVAPQAAWSHFLAQAYVVGQPEAKLTGWLDRPWARGDLYSIQKLVATLQALAN
jgi:outer membrane protein assembly factor BamB